jgi:NmrA-like family protein
VGVFEDPIYAWAGGGYVAASSYQFYEHDEKRGHVGGCHIACAGVGIPLPINWSLPGRPAWGAHFDAKGEANQLFTDMGVPTTFLLTTFYWDNFIHFGMGPKRTPDGTLAITLAMGEKKLPGIAAEDIGKCAYGIFQRTPNK